MRVDGRAGATFDLRFDIEAPDLASLYPGLTGALSGSGRLEGTPQVPLVSPVSTAGPWLSKAMRAGDLKLDVDWA